MSPLPCRRRLAFAGLAALLAAASAPLTAQTPPPRPLTHRDYDIWRTASGMTLAKDGRYLAYNLLPAEGDGEVVVRNLATGSEYRVARGGKGGEETPPAAGAAPAQTRAPATGGRPEFSPDGKRVLFPLAPTRGEVEKAKAEKKKADEMPQSVLAVMDLADGRITARIPEVRAFVVGGSGAGFVVYHKRPKPEDQPKTDPTKTGTTPGTGVVRGGFGTKGGTAPKGGTGTGTTTPPAPRFGTDLVVRDLATGSERTFPDVAEYTLAKDGKTLVFTVASRKAETNGVFAADPTSAAPPTVIRAGGGKFGRLTWDEKQTRLAFLLDDSGLPPGPGVAPAPRPAAAEPAKGPAATPPAPPKWRVMVWDRGAKPARPMIGVLPMGNALASLAPIGVAANAAPVSPAAEVLGPDSAGQRKGWAVTDRGGLSFSADGTKLFVTTAPAPAPTPPASGSADDRVNLDIWHWKDGPLQPMQQVRAGLDRAKSYRAVVLLDTKQFRQLADETADVFPPQTGDWAVGTDDRKYLHLTGYGPTLRDYALVNVVSGEKKPLMAGFGGLVSRSPKGNFLATFDGKDWHGVSVPDGKKVNLTAKLPVKFFNEEFDSPSEPPSYGLAGWCADGRSVLLNDRFDIWKVALDGSGAVNLTRTGRETGVEFRYAAAFTAADPDEESPEDARLIDDTKPLLLVAENLRTRDTGFFRLDPGAAPKLLVMGARRYSLAAKAKNADTFLVTVSTFNDYPDYYSTGPDFHELKRVTDVNPRKREFIWGKAELVRYKSADGVELAGMLVKPENFDPAKKYPMVVYIYERLSQNLHQFRMPTVGTSINPTFYASNGYLVFMPDIAYTVGAPGQSALKCVLPAIQAVVDKGCVKEDAIGIQGHSWGGYQIAYMVTQTNRFKAAAAGAPVSNMVSAYGGIRWGSGLPRQFQYERTQSRIGATLWQAPMKFIENSPIFMADRVKTPLLMLHNDQDDAVPWYQGIEYFLALRRLGREAYLLNYNGELHGLRRKATQKDYTMRMQQFFDHHLKGAPAPAWMEKGVPYLDRDREKEQWKEVFGPVKK